MDSFSNAFEATEAVERGFVDNPADPGGATNHGITERIARAAGYTGDMRDLPLETASAIARRYFWDPIHGDELAACSSRIAAKVFDLNFQFYAGAAGTFLQRTLAALGASDLVIDGHIGPATIAALKTALMIRPVAGEPVILRALEGLQTADYIRQVEQSPAKSAFLYGWLLKRVVQ